MDVAKHTSAFEGEINLEKKGHLANQTQNVTWATTAETGVNRKHPGRRTSGMFSFLLSFAFLMLIRAEAERFPVDCHHGRKGKLGQRGLNGLPGSLGFQGVVGPVGPTGPLATETFADLYFTGTTQISPGSFLFLTSENDLSPDFSISTDNSGTSITFLRTGIFMVSYIAQCPRGPKPVAVEATMDYVPVPLSRYGMDSGGKQLFGQVIIDVVEEGSVLRLRNPLADNLSFSSNGDSTNASLNVVRYGESGLKFYP